MTIAPALCEALCNPSHTHAHTLTKMLDITGLVLRQFNPPIPQRGTESRAEQDNTTHAGESIVCANCWPEVIADQSSCVESFSISVSSFCLRVRRLDGPRSCWHLIGQHITHTFRNKSINGSARSATRTKSRQKASQVTDKFSAIKLQELEALTCWCMRCQDTSACGLWATSVWDLTLCSCSDEIRKNTSKIFQNFTGFSKNLLSMTYLRT